VKLRTLLRNAGLVGLVGLIPVSCGSSDSRDRNVGTPELCNQGGACTVGEVGPAGGIVVRGATEPGVAMWEVAPMNGYGTFDEAFALVDDLEFGGQTGWILPSTEVVGYIRSALLSFACPADTDCGTEFNVVEMPNVVKEYLSHPQGQIMEGFGVEEKRHLFPNAIRIPGWSHSHDWILKRALTELPFWSTYLENARLLCWFLNNDSYREAFARDLKFALEGATLEELDWDPAAGTEFHANFAQWRFGTFALVAGRLHAAKGALQAGFVHEHFACKDSTKLANVNRVVYDPLFWTQNFVVHILAQRSEDSRQWGLGCVCVCAMQRSAGWRRAKDCDIHFGERACPRRSCSSRSRSAARAGSLRRCAPAWTTLAMRTLACTCSRASAGWWLGHVCALHSVGASLG